MSRAIVVSACALALLSWPRASAAQTDPEQFQIGIQVAGAVSGEFEDTDVGVGGRASWHPTPMLGAEIEFNVYPSDFTDDVAFSRGRVEGLFGATVGPRMGQFRPFVKLRPGFVTYREAPDPLVCIQVTVHPPPLPCVLATGHTAFALDFGGGVEVFPSERTFIRFDAGDRIVRYPGPATDSNGEARSDSFFGHDFRFSIGGGVRF